MVRELGGGPDLKQLQRALRIEFGAHGRGIAAGFQADQEVRHFLPLARGRTIDAARGGKRGDDVDATDGAQALHDGGYLDAAAADFGGIAAGLFKIHTEFFLIRSIDDHRHRFKQQGAGCERQHFGKRHRLVIRIDAEHIGVEIGARRGTPVALRKDKGFDIGHRRMGMQARFDLRVEGLAQVDALGAGEAHPQVSVRLVDVHRDGAEHADQQAQLHQHQEAGERHRQHSGEEAAPFVAQRGAGEGDGRGHGWVK